MNENEKKPEGTSENGSEKSGSFRNNRSRHRNRHKGPRHPQASPNAAANTDANAPKKPNAAVETVKPEQKKTDRNTEQQNRQNQQNRRPEHQNRPNRPNQPNRDSKPAAASSVKNTLSDISDIASRNTKHVTSSPFDFGDETFKTDTGIDDAILDAMPPDPTLENFFSSDASETPVKAQEPENGVPVVGIHFPHGGKVYWFDPAGIVFKTEDPVIVETARGTEVGSVAIPNIKVEEKEIVAPLRPVIRKATPEDLQREKENAKRSEEAIRICRAKVEKHKLDMKLVGAQYTFDNAKLIFYFTAAARVDFRELVKDLASEFHLRIELRQIGIRDEAKMLGGFGVCGRKLCCATFLPNFAQVSVKNAKEQGLSLNSSKISGNCGRLMCCLKYEQSTYESELALMPAPGSVVGTPDGKGTVTEVKPVGYLLKVKLDEKADQPPRQYSLSDITVISKKEYKPEASDPSDLSDYSESEQ